MSYVAGVFGPFELIFLVAIVVVVVVPVVVNIAVFRSSDYYASKIAKIVRNSDKWRS